MRFRFGEFRNVARAGAVTPGSVGPQRPFPNTASMRGAAVRRFHRDGEAAAILALDQSLTRWARTASTQGKARVTRQLFSTYVQRSDADGRAVLLTDLKEDVSVAGHEIGVTIDAVVMDTAGYVGRVLLWDLAGCDLEAAKRIAYVCFLAMDARLGSGRTVAVEVWDLRAGTEFTVGRTGAMRRRVPVERLLADMAAAMP